MTGAMMPTRVLGIDPGIASMGYGLIEDNKDELTTIDYGCLSTSAREGTPERLHTLYWGLIDLIERHQPSEVAVEHFIARNLRTALVVGQARGIAILAAANKGLPVYEYTPLEVKQNVSGYGRGGKRQIQEMVKIQLGLHSIPKPYDAADALAVAICHINKARLVKLTMHSH
jgi:crossover junction endodeoxyribonuclease RuvC